MVRVSCCYEAGREQARGERAHYCLPEKFKEKSGRRSPMRARSHMTCSDRKNTRALPCCCDCQQCKQIAKFWEKASYYEKNQLQMIISSFKTKTNFFCWRDMYYYSENYYKCYLDQCY